MHTHTPHIFIRICVHVYTQRFYVSTQTCALQMDVRISTSVPAWFLKACECQAHIMCSSVDATCAKLVMCCIRCVVSCGVYSVKYVVCAGRLFTCARCLHECMHAWSHAYIHACMQAYINTAQACCAHTLYALWRVFCECESASHVRVCVRLSIYRSYIVNV